MKIHNLLVPTDYTKASENAFRIAQQVAEPFGATLHVVHVYQVPADLYPYTLFITRETLETIRERETERLEAWCDSFREDGVTLVRHVVRGETHEEIETVARNLGVDLIVMGTRGNSGLKRAFLGSTAERTICLSECPVIATH